LIVASFDKTQNRTAAVSGAYQYDIGQRLVMHGLPSPSELAGEDDLLSGDLVTVQAQFSYVGDSQSEMRIATWDEERQAWLVGVPDEYLTRHREVHVYVFCYYGSDETGERGETAYEATFRPIGRPAPSGTVTEDQLRQWTNLKAEIEISLSKVEAAVGNANNAVDGLNAASEAAKNAAQSASASATMAEAAKSNLADSGNDSITQTAVTSVSAGSEATASLISGRLTIGAPKGATGAKGDAGEAGPSDVSFSFDSTTGTLTVTTM
jgi:hypothetical protein